MSKYVIGIDGGTMGVRCVILDLQGREVSSAYFETPTQYPRPGWVEQRAEDFMDLAVKSTAAAIAKGNIKGEDIAAVSFTNMRSTFVPVDKDGNFLHPIFIWQDLRGVEMYPWMEERMAKYGMDWAELYKISGFPKGAVWPSTKVYWYKKHFPELWDKTYKMVTPQGTTGMMTKRTPTGGRSATPTPSSMIPSWPRCSKSISTSIPPITSPACRWARFPRISPRRPA